MMTRGTVVLDITLRATTHPVTVDTMMNTPTLAVSAEIRHPKEMYDQLGTHCLLS